MTEEERDKMMRSNWAMQMYANGYGPDGLALPKEDVTPAGRVGQCPAPTDEAFGRWISVKDHLPAKDQDVIIYGKYTGQSGTVYSEIVITDIDEYTFGGYVPIAWMPLPEPPKEV